MPLTDTAIRTAKAEAAPYKRTDGAGLYLLVQPSGSKLWRMNYRYGGKRKTLAFGAYPIVTLVEARSRRDHAKKILGEGLDPGEIKKVSRDREIERVEEQVAADERAAENRFSVVAAEFLQRLEHNGAAAQTMKKARWLVNDLAADLHPKQMDDITSREVLQILQRVEASGRLDTAKRLRMTISRIFKLGVVTLRATTDPTYALIGATRSPKVKNRSAITDEKKLGWLLNAIDDYDGWPTIRCALQLQALTATRPIEVRGAQWTEFDFAQRTWTIPPTRTKKHSISMVTTEHVIHLTDQAVAVLDDIKKLTGRDRLVFSSIRDRERPLSENALNSSLRRMGVTPDEHTSHGFRSSFSTIMNGRGEDPEIVELCLAHKDGNKIRRAYNRARRWPERVAMMTLWADLLDQFRKL